MPFLSWAAEARPSTLPAGAKTPAFTNATLPAQMKLTTPFQWNTPEDILPDNELLGFLSVKLRNMAGSVALARGFGNGFEKWLQMELALALQTSDYVTDKNNKHYMIWSKGKTEMEIQLWKKKFVDIFVPGYIGVIPGDKRPNSGIELKVLTPGKHPAFQTEVIGDFDSRTSSTLEQKYLTDTLIYGFGITDYTRDVTDLANQFSQRECVLHEMCTAWGIVINNYNDQEPDPRNIYAIAWRYKPASYDPNFRSV